MTTQSRSPDSTTNRRHTVASVSSAADVSPFHGGEQAVQERMGVRDKLESVGRRLLLDFMPEQHREFLAQLPFVVTGARDGEGIAWASMLLGEPGFISTPDPQTLRIDARLHPEDPLRAALRVGSDVGLLGIELHTRRRNRVNGRVVEVDTHGFTLAVAQSFGNCPKYIQKRVLRLAQSGASSAKAPARVLSRLDHATSALIERADTFFIATHCAPQHGEPSCGADVSHRGGKPGFIRADGDRSLIWPDFVGNSMFNTLGNLVVNPGAGLLIADFEQGDLLQLSGRAEIIWDGPAVDEFAGAQRLVRFDIARLVHRPAALPLRGDVEEYSPFVAATGSWASPRSA